MTAPLDPNHRQGLVVKNVSLTGVVCLTFLLTGWSALQAQAEEILSTPTQVVHQWLQSYPNNLAHAVTFTSPDFRENLSPSEWISKKAPLLKNIRLEYLDSEILHEEINGTNAMIKGQGVDCPDCRGTDSERRIRLVPGEGPRVDRSHDHVGRTIFRESDVRGNSYLFSSAIRQILGQPDGSGRMVLPAFA